MIQFTQLKNFIPKTNNFLKLSKRTYVLETSHPSYRAGVPRILPKTPETNARQGRVIWDAKKSGWFSTMILGSITGIYLTFDPATIFTDFSVFFVTTGVSVLFGHSLGMHRKWIHNSYECPKWLEYLFIHLGTIMGIAGPVGMMRAHDFRDWAQRQPPNQCHPYFSQKSNFILDSHWQMCCRMELDNPPEFKLDLRSIDPIILWMEKYWMLQQVPLALILYTLGGWNWVVWGTFVRTFISMHGHFYVGWFAHNDGKWASENWHIPNCSTQGKNVGHGNLQSKILQIMTAGESLHNNHHAYPASAKLALKPGEIDIGWCTLKILEKIGLVWNMKQAPDVKIHHELVPKE